MSEHAYRVDEGSPDLKQGAGRRCGVRPPRGKRGGLDPHPGTQA